MKTEVFKIQQSALTMPLVNYLDKAAKGNYGIGRFKDAPGPEYEAIRKRPPSLWQPKVDQ